MTPKTEYFLGLDLGGTQLKVQALSPQGETLERLKLPSNGDWKTRVLGGVSDVERRLGRAAAIGVAAPGLVARDGRSIAHMPGRLSGLEGLDWQTLLQRDDAVPVINDAQAALLGEIWRGAAHAAKDAILLTLGTGVGGAAVIDGHLLRGNLGRAGHFGHISLDPAGPLDIVGTPGSLEDAIGNHSLPLRSNGKYTDSATLANDVARGDAFASQVWETAIDALAAGITSLINALDPAIVLIGGGIAEAGDALISPLKQRLDRIEWRPGGRGARILTAQLGEWAGTYGAAYNTTSEKNRKWVGRLDPA